MTTAWVMLKTIKDMQDFVNLVSDYGCRMELVARHQVINAKSIIGPWIMGASSRTARGWSDPSGPGNRAQRFFIVTHILPMSGAATKT